MRTREEDRIFVGGGDLANEDEVSIHHLFTPKPRTGKNKSHDTSTPKFTVAARSFTKSSNNNTYLAMKVSEYALQRLGISPTDRYLEARLGVL